VTEARQRQADVRRRGLDAIAKLGRLLRKVAG